MAQLDADQYEQLTKDAGAYGTDYGLFWDKTNSKIALVVADSVVAEFDANGLSAEELVLASQAQGDLMRYSGSAWERFAAGTTGQLVIGDGTDVTSVAMSNDATIVAAGTLTLADQWRARSVTSDTTAGAYTYLIAGMKLGAYLRDPNGGDRSDVTDTAANIVGGLLVPVANESFVDFKVVNTADADETITLTAGAGVTLSPTTIEISRGQVGYFRAVCTNVTASSEAVTVYQLDNRQVRGHVLVGSANGQRRSLPLGAAHTFFQSDGTDAAWVALSQDATLAAGVITLADEFRTRNTTTDSTAGAYTYLVAGMLLGHYLRDPAGGDRSDVTDTAANIVAGYTGAAVGSYIDFVITNTADADETITLTAGSGVTLSPTTQKVSRGQSCWFRARMDNVTGASEAVTVYQLGARQIRGHILIGDSGGQRRSLPPGSASQILQSDATDVAYQSMSGDGSLGASAAFTATHATSWAWSHGKPSGEDTDAAGTNGAGMTGGQDVDLSTHQFNNSGGNVYVKCYDKGTTTWDDLSTSSSLGSWTNNYQLLPDAAAPEVADDAFAIGFDNQFCEVCFNDLATGNGALATWGGNGGKWQYSTGAGTWSDLTVFDNTDATAQDGLRSLQRAGAISFAPPSDWVVATYDSQEAYWIQYIITAEQLTQTPIIDDTNKDEPFVVVPDAHAFTAPHACTIDAVRVTNMHDTVHDQAIKFVIGAFTNTKPAAGFSLSAEQTWTASKETMRFDLSSRKPVIAAGQLVGICVTDDGGSTNNPVFHVDMKVTLT